MELAGWSRLFRAGQAFACLDRRTGFDLLAEGRWLLTSNGKMCMELVWRSTAYAATPIRTCFSHRIQDGNVEQRKDPDGGWYSFKHASDDASGEHRKFQEGDAKNIEFETARKLVDPKG